MALPPEQHRLTASEQSAAVESCQGIAVRLGRRWALRSGAGEDGTDDLVGTARLALVDAARRYDRRRDAKFSTFAFVFVDAACRRQVARDAVRRTVSLDVAAREEWRLADPRADDADRAALVADLAEAIDALPPAERIALRGRLDGKRTDAIAKEIGCEVECVYRVLERAKLRLRRERPGLAAYLAN